MEAITQAIAENIQSEFSTWFVGVIIGILGVFSTYLTEKIKSAINRADSRTKTYEALSAELSNYVFLAELLVEFVGKSWTTKTTLTDLVTKYNESVTALRKNEYKYVAEVSKYWGSDSASALRDLFVTIKDFDRLLHALNDQFEAVNITEAKPKVDPTVAKNWLEKAQPLLDHLCSTANTYLRQQRL